MASVEKCFYEYFHRFAKSQGEKLFLFDEDRRYSASETFREAIAIGNKLYALGVREGSLVALRCTRSVDAYLIFLALEFMGATAILTNPYQTVADFLREAEVDIRPDLTVTNEAAAGGIAANGNWDIPGHGKLIIGDGKADAVPLFPVGQDLGAPAVVVFTSGSTGKSKGAMLSQRAMLQYSEDSIVHPWHSADDVAIVTLPTQHGFALCLLVAAFVAGYALFYPKDMHAEYTLECIEKYSITRINGVPSYLYVLARANEVFHRDISSLRTGFTAGAPINPAQHRFIEDSLGIVLHPLYGMSESISISCTAPSDSPERRATTVGKFHRNAGSIVGPDGKELPAGKEGEICVSGPAILNGYYNDEANTSRSIDVLGRFHTGDLGYVDEDGYLHISGRIKDIIIRNGVNLSPVKIENAIRSIPGVEDASVVGLGHEMLGEAPCALVVMEEGHGMTEERLKKLLSTRLAKNAIPVSILFSSELPLNRIGKPDKKKVKEWFHEWIFG